MKDEEKNLIENLFHRLKNTELNSSERDNSADDLIQKLVKNQPASSYYMAQTILIQETAIKKMSIEIEELKKRIETLNSGEKKQKPSFLSNFFKTNSNAQMISPNNNSWKNKETPLQYHNSNVPVSPSTPVLQTTRSSGFLSNALQTATGVAGGMILGNMLMNVFNHSKPEETFDTINKSSENHTEEHLLNNESHNDYISDDQCESDINKDLCNDSTLENSNHFEQTDDFDMNDDNFI